MVVWISPVGAIVEWISEGLAHGLQKMLPAQPLPQSQLFHAADLHPYGKKGALTPLGNTDIEMLPSEVIESSELLSSKAHQTLPHKTHKLQSAQKYTSVINGLERQ